MTKLPERFANIDPSRKSLTDYIARKWSKHGYRREEHIIYNPEWTPEYRKYEVYRWVEKPSDGLRFVGKVHEIRGDGQGNVPYFDRCIIEHTGWYIDNYQDETVCGEVYQLPARKGKSLYISAVSDPWNDAACLDFRSVTDDLLQAIRNADRMAELWAESERECQARETAKERTAEIDQEIRESYAGLRKLCAEIRANRATVCSLDEIKALIRREYHSVRAHVRGLRKEKAKIEDNYWEASPQW